MSLTVDSTARAMADAVRRREISARELLELHLARIAERNPELNAIVSLDEERARAGAAEADAATARGDALGPLHGLPFAFKDTHDVAGWRTTYGSPLFADHVPDTDDLVVARIRAAGAVPIGRTNVPEFAAGSHTFNPVFGTTLNPVDPTRSAGGSSGGAACALRAGMVPLADGSDMGGSLRNPASFCGVVGLRPSLGRVPSWPTDNLWETTGTSGPLARNVGDLALLLSVIAGPDPRVPTALADPGIVVRRRRSAVSSRGLRVAVSPDLGGLLEVDREVAGVVEQARRTPRGGRGPRRDRPTPTSPRPRTRFRTLRAWLFQAGFGELLAAHPDDDQDTRWPTTSGPARASPGPTSPGRTPGAPRWPSGCAASSSRTTCWSCRPRRCRRSRRTRSTPPTINGRPMATYLDWMRSCYVITVTGCPAISVPAGHTARRPAGRGADRRPVRRRPTAAGGRGGLRGRGFLSALVRAGSSTGGASNPVEGSGRSVDQGPTGCGRHAGTRSMSKKVGRKPLWRGASRP